MAVRDRLRSLWSEPRVPGAPVRVWRDWALVAILVPAAVLEGVLRPDLEWRWAAVAIGVGLVATLLWRRTHPLVMVAIAFGTIIAFDIAHQLTDGGEPIGLNTMAYLLLLPYSLTRWGSGREIAMGAPIPLAAACLVLLEDEAPIGDLIGGFAVLALTMAVGAAVRFQTSVRERELDQVRMVERERLARDLHDTVAHHVSAIAIRAQAGLATAASRPDAAADALRVIEGEASRTLAEMRSMVRILRRDQDAELTPQPHIADLDRLAVSGDGGPCVTVELVGDLEDVPDPVATAVYRLAQESVTNAQRHARNATRIEVCVRGDGTSVRLRVNDDGDVASARQPPAPGYGILGMIERADLLGGTCRAGPDSGGQGWTVTAVLPRDGRSPNGAAR